MSGASVLLVDDDQDLLQSLAKFLRRRSYAVHTASSGEAALRLLAGQSVQVVLTDLRMEPVDGLTVLREARRLDPDVEVILLTGHASVDSAIAALKDGALDYLTKPVKNAKLLHTLQMALDRQASRRRDLAHAAPQRGLAPFIAESPAMKRVLALVAQLAPHATTVLIQGESGTGKELVARALHTQSPRHAEPLVAFNCAAFTETLVESELFGYEPGAFTGATRRKPGRFELAHGSSLLLDEVAELAPTVQAKLLRVLQERTLERVGGTRTIPVDVRILAASNQDLATLVRQRRFREDLFHRLDVGVITLPPLRDRPEDFLPLAEHFLRLRAREHGKPLHTLTADALALLRTYPWPGNIRELDNTLLRAVLAAPASADQLEATHIALPREPPTAGGELPPASATLAEVERWWILRTLDRLDGNQSAAAEALGIDRSTLHRKVQQPGKETPREHERHPDR